MHSGNLLYYPVFLQHFPTRIAKTSWCVDGQLVNRINGVDRSWKWSSPASRAAGRAGYENSVFILSAASVMCFWSLIGYFWSQICNIVNAKALSLSIRLLRIHNLLSCQVAVDRSDFLDWFCWREIYVRRSCLVSEMFGQPSYEQWNRLISRHWNDGSWFQYQQPRTLSCVSGGCGFLL